VTGLLERDEEVAALRTSIARLHASGEGGVVLIEGPLGIGKSALLDAALADAPGVVLRARGSELDSALAFGAVRQLLMPALRRLTAGAPTSCAGCPTSPTARSSSTPSCSARRSPDSHLIRREREPQKWGSRRLRRRRGLPKAPPGSSATHAT
jgi:hypothetical protein